MMKRVIPTLAYATVMAIAPMLFCSCQTLQNGGAKGEPSRLAPAQVNTADPSAADVVAPQPVPGRPVATAGYYPSAVPHQAHVAMMPMPAQHGAPCPCCGPKAKFAFSDECNACGAAGNCGPEGCGPGGCGPGGCHDGSCPYQPYDEYICDGGDVYPGVVVRQNHRVDGLEQEDTIVHYDTIRNGTEWTHSNKVCIYSPRFAAVRQVTGMELSEQADRLALADKSLPPILDRDLKIVSDLNQPQQPIGEVGIKQAQSFLERQPGLTAETTRHLAQAHLDLLPYENLELIRRGVMESSEKLRLAQVAANAIVWNDTKAVQVVVDKKLPLEAVRDTKVGETVMYDLAGKPRMRICKIADSSEAQPGDIVSFTLRFDNVGDQKVSNVTIIDNLTSRLEYVEGSQECSHKAAFETTPNDGETLVLRWEIEDPLRVGEGGIIRFKCRVR